MLSQKEQILRHLTKGESITPLQAFAKYCCLRLAARINDLRQDGHHIKTTTIKTRDGKHYAQYSLEKA